MVVANSYCIAVSLDLWDHANTQYQYVMTLLLAEVPAPTRPKASTVLHLPDKRDGCTLKCAVCGSNTIYICTTCNVSLHPAACFAKYHTAQEEEEHEEEEESEDEGEDDVDEEVEESEEDE